VEDDMSHVAFRREPYQAETDYVVIGSGAGGATAAAALAGSGAHVTLVEAGAWLDPEHYPSSVYGTMRTLFDNWGTLVTRGRALWPIVQGRSVGGSTVINSAICVRTPEDVFDRWEREAGISGLREPVRRHQESLERELSATPVPAASAGRGNELAHLGADRLGYENHVITRYVKGCAGAGQCLQGCRGGRKQSLNITLVPQVLLHGGDVLSCAPVERILLAGRRAVGVRGRFRHPHSQRAGGRFEIRARRAVVVAASVTWSPVLLQRSGVALPALGQHFRAHPGAGVFGVYDEPVDMNRGATQGWGTTAFRDDPGFKLETLSLPPEMIASRLSGGGSALASKLREYRHLAMWVAAVRAETVGSVRPGLLGRPVIRYTPARADMDRLRRGLAVVARTHFAAGARRVLPGIYGLPYAIGPDEVRLIEEGPLDPRAYVAVLSHLFGGCVMGRDPACSVVDERGRVHGYDGLVVADASVIPSNLGVNPQHTIMALARTFAERLVEQAA
jgi:choline dehydrogenase-like flavoprotein